MLMKIHISITAYLDQILQVLVLNIISTSDNKHDCFLERCPSGSLSWHTTRVGGIVPRRFGVKVQVLVIRCRGGAETERVGGASTTARFHQHFGCARDREVLAGWQNILDAADECVKGATETGVFKIVGELKV
jgi:hypothetical protein